MPPALECLLPELYDILLHRIGSRLYAESACIGIRGTHPVTSMTARFARGASPSSRPEIVLTFTREETGQAAAQTSFTMGSDGLLRPSDGSGQPLAQPTSTASRSLIGNKTYLHLHDLPWKRMETHDLTEHLTVHPLSKAPPERPSQPLAPPATAATRSSAPLRQVLAKT